ncbi:enoyl-CoA hydratase [Halioglobus sp. HI00S01]|uniref:enoyl-CoA hydratase/isomerase family protein n=1 Tax=Halioglobus sp. HI00S01 TaxID=1822214 RepID=UPI0007C40663|nr:enoyl-CoA hydratase/isomerase family protein [Halioglobus sp. HI00S01]KZX57121.1 enoyl-CoA hydratase [Halioglobus sp. HI00S01]
MSENLKVGIESGIATLTLNRPESMNALNHALFRELEIAIADLGKRDDVACVILCGEGKAFSSGHDLRDIESGGETEHSQYEATVLEALASLSVPTIAQVHKYCFTGALELALACDLIFVDEATVLADTHSQWGLSPVWGMTQRLPRRVGAARAKDMMFSARRVGAEEALRIGLVDRVFATGELASQTRDYALAVAKNSRHSHQVCKSIIEATDGLRLHEGLDYEYTNSPGACSDMQARVAVFTSKS